MRRSNFFLALISLWLGLSSKSLFWIFNFSCLLSCSLRSWSIWFWFRAMNRLDYYWSFLTVVSLLRRLSNFLGIEFSYQWLSRGCGRNGAGLDLWWARIWMYIYLYDALSAFLLLFGAGWSNPKTLSIISNK